jgi:hypothetical protein
LKTFSNIQAGVSFLWVVRAFGHVELGSNNETLKGTLGEISANSEQGSSEMYEAGITHGRFGSEFWSVSKLDFYGHPNSGILASKFQMDNSKPQFIHPNRHSLL